MNIWIWQRFFRPCPYNLDCLIKLNPELISVTRHNSNTGVSISIKIFRALRGEGAKGVPLLNLGPNLLYPRGETVPICSAEDQKIF